MPGGIKQSAVAANLSTPGISNPLSQFFNNQPPLPPGGQQPRAFLNIIFFDEQFKYVSTSSTALPVAPIPDGSTSIESILATGNITVPSNGYVYIFLSNESSFVPVFFDNFQVAHTRGAILEDNAYYPFGLKIAGISAKAFDAPKNPYQYQGDYSEYDDETQWNEFALRNYDPQIGRFVQADPYSQFPSPYTGMGNDPVNNVDPSGGWAEGLSAVSQFAVNHFAPAMIGGIIGGFNAKANGGNIGSGFAKGFGIGLAASYVATEVNWSAVGGALGDAGRWVGGLFQGAPILWILYNGTHVIGYEGKEGNTSKQIFDLPGTSGIIKDGKDYRNSQFQEKKDEGPVPEGRYRIKLKPKPSRVAKANPETGEIYSNPEGGIEMLPESTTTLDGRRATYAAWGTMRARLEPLPGTNTFGRDNFYFHNSHKGFSHGCVETKTVLFGYLIKYRQLGSSSVKVRINYPTSNSSTLGNTKY